MNVAFLCLPVVALAALGSGLAALDALAVVGGRHVAAALPVLALLWGLGAWTGVRLGGTGAAARWLGAAALAAAWTPGPLAGSAWAALAPLTLAGAGLGALLAARRDRGRPTLAGALAAHGLGGAIACVLWLALLRDGSDTALAAAVGLALAGALAWALDVADAAGAGEAVAASPSGPWFRYLLDAAAGALLLGGVTIAFRVAAQLAGDDLVLLASVAGATLAVVAAGALLVLLAPGWGARLPTGAIVIGLGVVGAPLAWSWIAWGSGPWVAALLLVLPCALPAGIVLGARRRPAGALLAGAVGAALAGAAVVHVRVAAPDVLLAERLATLGVVVAGLAWLASLLALRASSGHRWVAALAALVVAGLGFLGWRTRTPLPIVLRPDATEVIARVEDPRGVVAAIATAAGDVRVTVDGQTPLAGPAEVELRRRLGRIAAAFRPEATTALRLGLGRGHVLAGLVETTFAQVTCVERRAAVRDLDLPLPVDASRAAGGPPTVTVADPGTWLAEHPGAYDLIVLGPVPPDARVDAELHTVEFLQGTRRALTEDGVTVLWLPMQLLPWSAFGPVANAFREVYPAARLFLAAPLADPPLVALVGGLPRGLPDPAAVDALLAATATELGPNGMPDVFDLSLSDAWGLTREFREAPVNRRDDPVASWRSLRLPADPLALAAGNLQQLLALAAPLDVSALERVPSGQKVRYALAEEFDARGRALAGLLLARASLLELAQLDPLAEPVGSRILEERLNGALVDAWRVFPGHRTVRRALRSRSAQLVQEGRLVDAGVLLEAALLLGGDGELGTLLGSLLLELGEPGDAVGVLQAAAALAPGDPMVLVQLGTAYLMLEDDGPAREALAAARALAGNLPPLPQTAWALLEGLPDAQSQGRQLVQVVGPESPWGRVLQRLLDAG